MKQNRFHKRDGQAVVQLLQSMQARPSASHDNAVFEAAERVLGKTRAARRKHSQLPVALAASLLVAASMALKLNAPPEPAPMRALAISPVPAAGDTLSGVPRIFRWASVAGASGYRVILRDASAEVLWTSEVLTAPQLELPHIARHAIAGRDTCIWSVDVIGGGRHQELGPYWFHFGTP